MTENGFSKSAPFSRERTFSNGLARPPVPVDGVGEIALFAVQIGMNPGALAVRLIDLSEGVSLIPVTAGIPPKRLKSRFPVPGWFLESERSFKFSNVHNLPPHQAHLTGIVDQVSGDPTA
jgi:hypothetical protein